MSFDAQRLADLLPALYRLRDAELTGKAGGLLTAAEEAELAALEGASPLDPAERRRLGALQAKRDRGPLGSLLALVADQLAVVEENLDQLYDDQFVETCAPWAVPYIGDLIGYRVLHGRAPGAGSRRAEVAHTIGFRRRKGTAAMLEQLARDVTGWNARAVEFFQLLATTQYMNHLRPHNVVTPDMRNGLALERVGTAFDPIPRTLEVRRIASGRGRYNVPNVGLFLWRLDAQRLARSPATPHPGDATGRRFRFSPLGHDLALCTRPETERTVTHLAEPLNVPAPITRRALRLALDDYYGEHRSLAVWFDDAVHPAAQICMCNLADDGADWAHDAPAGKVAVDPVLGRLAVAADVALPGALRVTFHYAAPSGIAGGAYPRLATFTTPPGAVQRVPDDHPTIQDALDALGGSGIVEITDSGRYVEAIAVDVAADAAIELRAADGERPTVELTAPMSLRGGASSSAIINGLLIAGAALEVPAAGNDLRRLEIRHATLVPGLALHPDGAPDQPGAPSVIVARAGVELVIERGIVGALRVVAESTVRAADSIVDACGVAATAYAALDDSSPGGAATLEACTVVGEVRAASLYASNSILLSRATVLRRQEGCVRFSYLPLDSVAPRRFRCQPGTGDAAGNVPRFTTLRYGAPGYAQLTARTPPAIRRGADDESEMGAHHYLYEPQRESDLLTRLDEYLRVGLEAGIFHES